MVPAPAVTTDQLATLPLGGPLRDDFITLWQAHIQEAEGVSSWQGRLHHPPDLQVLNQVEAVLELTRLPPELAALPPAVATVLALTQAPVTIPFDVPVPARPSQADLGPLGDKLMIATVVMRDQGHMTPQDAKLLIDALPAQVDKRAVPRLYKQALFSGPPGHVPMIRTRRGTAAPSEMQSWQPELLSEDLL